MTDDLDIGVLRVAPDGSLVPSPYNPDEWEVFAETFEGTVFVGVEVIAVKPRGRVRRWWRRLRCPHPDTRNAGLPGVWTCLTCGATIRAPGPR